MWRIRILRSPNQRANPYPPHSSFPQNLHLIHNHHTPKARTEQGLRDPPEVPQAFVEYKAAVHWRLGAGQSWELSLWEALSSQQMECRMKRALPRQRKPGVEIKSKVITYPNSWQLSYKAKYNMKTTQPKRRQERKHRKTKNRQVN